MGTYIAFWNQLNMFQYNKKNKKNHLEAFAWSCTNCTFNKHFKKTSYSYAFDSINYSFIKWIGQNELTDSLNKKATFSLILKLLVHKLY